MREFMEKQYEGEHFLPYKNETQFNLNSVIGNFVENLLDPRMKRTLRLWELEKKHTNI